MLTPVYYENEERIATTGASIAEYVWLPLEWDEDRPILQWRDEWEIEP